MLSTSQTVKLNNGTEADSMVVALVMLYLKQLFEGDMGTFRKLVKACMDTEYRLSGGALKILEHYHLCENGIIEAVVKDILLSAIVKINDELTLLNCPIDKSGLNLAAEM